MKIDMPENSYSKLQLTGLLVLRIFVGWHFLYEGFVKLVNPYWSSAEYLQGAGGIFSRMFESIVVNPVLLKIVDQLNIWGLILIGSALIAGCLFRVTCVFGMILLSMYYFSNPPFLGISATAPVEGNYLFVNKNLIEIAALWVLYLFPTGQIFGLDRLIFPTHRKESK